MTKKIIHTVLTSVFLLTTNIMASTLTVKTSAVETNNGDVFIGVFNDAKEFPDGEPFQKIILPSKESTVKHIFKLPAGKYAIAIFQDRNSNKKLDKNFFGIPKEKYGFSGKQVFGQPSFQDASIDIKVDNTPTINLK